MDLKQYNFGGMKFVPVACELFREISCFPKDWARRLLILDQETISPAKMKGLPYMTVGGNTFINAMLEAAGFENIYTGKTRYPEITIDELRIADCQLLFLSSEPYPFKQKHIGELQLQLPNTKIILADGEMFSWYGSRLLKAPAYFSQLQKQIR